MTLFSRKSAQGQDGFAMLQVMVAMGILGILITVFSGLVSQTVRAQKIARIHGEKVSLQAVFRGSVTCETSCADLKRDVPRQVGQWKIKPVCSDRKLVLNVAHPEIYNGNFSRLFKKGQDDAVCKQIVNLGTRTKTRVHRRRMCSSGEKVTNVNFAEQTVNCR